MTTEEYFSYSNWLWIWEDQLLFLMVSKRPVLRIWPGGFDDHGTQTFPRSIDVLDFLGTNGAIAVSEIKLIEDRCVSTSYV